ncbi:acetate--CoA ligase [bacterium]|nr:acetate--CoA ligase [bacterium]
MEYSALYRQSIDDPRSYWLEQSKRIHWFTPFDEVLQGTDPRSPQWFAGGTTNICYNAVDRHAMGSSPFQPAIIWESAETNQRHVYTYTDLYVHVNRVASALRRQGIGQGDRVVIYMPMVPEALFAMLACARLGAVHSVVFGGFSAESLAQRIDDSNAKLVICADGGLRKGKLVRLKRIVDRAMELLHVASPRVLVFDRGIAGWSAVEGRDLSWAAQMAESDDETVDPVPVASGDPSYILYTSGTTGRPKGVVRDTGGYMVMLAATMEQIYGAGPGDVFWAASDIGWVVGHSYIVYAPLLVGATTVLYEGTPDYPTADIWWRLIEREKVNVMFTAPTAMRLLAKHPVEMVRSHDLSSLRHLFLAGEPLDETTYEWARETLQKPVIDHYWQTESGAPMLANFMGTVATQPFKPGSPTFPAMGWDLDVVGAQGEVVAPGVKGILRARLPLPPGSLTTIWGDHARFVSAYFKQDEKGRWYYDCGDFAEKDADGYFWVLGRSDEVINVAGHRLGTREIEEVLAEHPNVAEAAVIGVADELKGQAIVAFVVPRKGVADTTQLESELQGRIRESIGAIATPRQLSVVRSLPKTRSGKVLRRVLKALSEGRATGDLSTIEDPSTVENIRDILAERRSFADGPRSANVHPAGRTHLREPIDTN